MQSIRYCLSQCFRTSITRIDDEFDVLLLQDKAGLNERAIINKIQRDSKYDGLRSYYQQKYSTDNTTINDATKV